MRTIALIYKKLLAFFSINKTSSSDALLSKDEYIGSLCFYLTKNKEIDTMCTIPDILDKSVEELSEISDSYARFLLYINEGYLKEDVFSILDEQDKRSDLTEEQRTKNKLFIDNVLFNWALIHVESLKSKKNRKSINQPLVRPSSVFNGQ